MKPIITVKDLNKTFKQEIRKSGFKNKLKSIFKPEYNDFEAVSSIGFQVMEGEKVAFLGPNGAGKSTTIKMLTGILHSTSGSIDVMGFDPAIDREKYVYNIGAVFGQVSRLWYHLTPGDSFELFGKMFDVPKEKLATRIDYLVSKFEIEDIIDLPVRKLSLGQRMRCEVVASLIHSPKIIFLDEPTIGLDMIAKQKLREIINEINITEGTTIFLTSHDLGDVENICKRVIIINHGKILYDGNLKELRRNYVKVKNIRVKFENMEKTFEPLGFMKMKKEKGDFVEFEIPNTKENLAKTFEILTGDYAVEDITIEDPDIEDIIREFY
ncbi:MAG: ATP-binding cassette domain-containing protein [Candidatus Gracilibacteria bacterium]|nr:ATP-binding cassette domain-containing protein [Candidatus Gracilibacteria bacterium]